MHQQPAGYEEPAGPRWVRCEPPNTQRPGQNCDRRQQCGQHWQHWQNQRFAPAEEPRRRL